MSVLIKIELDDKNISVNRARPGQVHLSSMLRGAFIGCVQRDGNGEVVAWGTRIEADCIRDLIWIEEDHIPQLRVTRMTVQKP